MAVSESQKRANKKWDDANKERKAYINKRSTARSFVKNLATLEDLAELTQLIEERRNMLENWLSNIDHSDYGVVFTIFSSQIVRNSSSFYPIQKSKKPDFSGFSFG